MYPIATTSSDEAKFLRDLLKKTIIEQIKDQTRLEYKVCFHYNGREYTGVGPTEDVAREVALNNAIDSMISSASSSSSSSSSPSNFITPSPDLQNKSEDDERLSVSEFMSPNLPLPPDHVIKREMFTELFGDRFGKHPLSPQQELFGIHCRQHNHLNALTLIDNYCSIQKMEKPVFFITNMQNTPPHWPTWMGRVEWREMDFYSTVLKGKSKKEVKQMLGDQIVNRFYHLK